MICLKKILKHFIVILYEGHITNFKNIRQNRKHLSVFNHFHIFLPI